MRRRAGTARSGRIVKLFGQTEALVGETVDSFLPEDGSVQAAYLVNSGLIEVHLRAEGADREALDDAAGRRGRGASARGSGLPW